MGETLSIKREKLRQETGYDAIEKTRRSDKDATFYRQRCCIFFHLNLTPNASKNKKHL